MQASQTEKKRDPVRLGVGSNKHLGSSSLNVLLVTPRGLDGKGGIDRLFRYLAADTSYVNDDHIKVRFFTSRGDSIGSGWLASFPFRVLLYLGELAFQPVDIVHLNLSINASAYRKYILLVLARVMRKKVVVHFHGGGFEHMLCRPDFSVRVVLTILRMADQNIVLGEFWRRLLGEAAHLNPANTHVVYNAVPDIAGSASLVRSHRSPLRLIFAGELHSRKGIDVLLEALAALDQFYPSWTCIIAGNGPKELYQATAERLGIGQKASFTGWISPEQLHLHMLASDIIVLPSRGEGLPLCLVEAAAASVAMLATDEGATRDVLLDGINGTIIPLDAKAIADAIHYLGENRDILSSMQSASRSIYLERFGLPRMIHDLHAVYQRAANR